MMKNAGGVTKVWKYFFWFSCYHLVIVAVDPIKVEDEGDLDEGGHVGNGGRQVQGVLHGLHDEEDGPEAEVAEQGPQ